MTDGCPVPACKTVLGETRTGVPFLMCRDHWSRVPPSLQARVWRTLRRWRELLADLEQLPTNELLIKGTIKAFEDYQGARDAAILAAAGQVEAIATS